MDLANTSPARPLRAPNPRWVAISGSLVVLLHLGTYLLRRAPLTPLDLWYPEVQVLWASLLLTIALFAGLFRQAQRESRRAIADPTYLERERAKARDLLIARRGWPGALVFLWPFMLLALFAGGVFLVMAIQLLQTSSDSNFAQSMLQAVALLPIGILGVGVASYWLRTHARGYTPPAPFTPAEVRGRLRTQTLLMGAVIMAGTPILFLYGMFYTNPQQGTAASWAAQRDFAQVLATRIDSAAVLESIQVRPSLSNTPRPPADTVLILDFVFVRPNGATIRLEIADTDPPRLIYANREGFAYRNPPTAEGQATARALLALNQQSPRDLYQATLPLARQKLPANSVPHMSMSFDDRPYWQSQYGRPGGWNIFYDSADFQHTLELWVDPQTGAILGQDQ